MKKNLKKSNHSSHLRKIFIFVTVGLTCIFLCIGMIGYATFGNDSPDFDLIILRPALPGSKDIAMKIGLVLVSLINLVCLMVYANSWKSQFLGFFDMNNTTWKNIGITILIIYIPYVVGWSYPYATKVFGIVGSFLGTLLITTFPGMLYLTYLKLTKRLWSIKFFMILIWCALSTILGFISGTALLIELFK